MEREVLKEDVQRFQQIVEYVEMSGNLIEDGEDQNLDPNAGNDAAPGAPAAPAGPAGPAADPTAMGGAPDMNGGAPDMSGAGPLGGPAAGPDAGNAEDPSAGGEGAPAPEGFDPQVSDISADDSAAAVEQPGADDNVLDVDDLTNAQEEANAAIQGLDSKFEKLVGTLDKFISAIDKNDAEIQNLKQELEKRNPTPLEKLDLRSVNDSFPYNVKPTDYWKDKEATSNYRVGGDDETPKQYDLHQSDVDNFSDWKSISDSLDDEDFSSISKLVNF